MRSTLPSVLEEFEFEGPPHAPTTMTATSANTGFRQFIISFSFAALD
jgi:hypothetical protein